MSPESGSVHVGTSGWSYDDWTGRFYPANLAPRERLTYYAERFDTVELNASFYRVPFAGMVAGWNRRLPETFHFVAKGHRRITHYRKLVDVEEELERTLERLLEIRTLRVVLWQLPPSLHRDVMRLEGFLTLLPESVRHAFEFRHPSWWCDEVRELLGHHRAAFVSVSHPKLPSDVVVSTDFLYTRFHGLGRRLYDYDYPDTELSEWAERFRPHLSGRTLYAFFNNDIDANAPANALRLISLLKE
ncbi:MAG: DUF72 domain-containing protein [Gemmatimonadota bacterium]